MSEFQKRVLALAADQQVPGWLQSFRSESAALWQQSVWPGRKTEAWRYTSLQPLENADWTLGAEADALPESDELLALDNALRLVFVNGRFVPEHSSPLPTEVVRFSQADAAQQQLIAEHLNGVADQSRHLFAAMNGALLDDGLLLHVKANQRLAQPVYVLHHLTDATAAVANQRLLVVLETGAEAQVIEHYTSAEGVNNLLLNSLTELVVQDNATLAHYRLNLEDEGVLHLGGVHANLHRHARLQGFTLASGSRLKRIDYQLRHLGEGADLDLKGIYLPRNNQRIDYHTNVEHCVPHCVTNEVFRGVVADTAKAVFNGRIHIHPHAQKTLAEMSNRNLLTSPRAEVNTKPELEIYADDVRCAHGATVSQLNDEALFYLTSRGISVAEARVLLSFGFVNELIEGLPLDAVKTWLRPRMAQAFGQHDSLTRHIIHD